MGGGLGVLKNVLASKHYVNPLVSMVYLVWSFYMIYSGMGFFVLVASIAISIYLGIARKLTILLLWVALPSFLILFLLYGLWDAAVTTLRIATIALAATTAFASPKPQHTAYMLYKIGVPPLIAYSHLYVYRFLQLLSYALNEAIDAAHGRGVRSRFKILMLLPIPLLVYTINTSTYLAEALYIKYPRREKTWVDKPGFRLVDILLVLYILTIFIIFILYILGHDLLVLKLLTY